MGLEQRVTELERRLAELEGTSVPKAQGAARGSSVSAEGDPSGADPRTGPEFWALQRLKVELANIGSHDGGVQFSGSVRLPTHERYEGQYGTVTEQLLDSDWSGEAESFAALGHGVRLRLLREIIGGRRTAAALADLEDMGTSGQIYHHLRQLTAAGWLVTARRGTYEVPAGRVVPLFVMLSAARR